MSSRDSRRSARALILAAALAFASFPAFAMPRDGASRLGDAGVFSAFFETLRSAWLHVWGEEGASIDPDGRPAGSRMTNVRENEGITIDPDGRPNGSDSGTAATDEGMLIDPHG